MSFFLKRSEHILLCHIACIVDLVAELEFAGAEEFFRNSWAGPVAECELLIFRHCLPVNHGGVVVRIFLVIRVLFNCTIGLVRPFNLEPYAEPRRVISITSLSVQVRAEVESLSLVDNNWIEAGGVFYLIAALIDPEVI